MVLMRHRVIRTSTGRAELWLLVSRFGPKTIRASLQNPINIETAARVHFRLAAVNLHVPNEHSYKYGVWTTNVISVMMRALQLVSPAVGCAVIVIQNWMA